jgi:hypothetical protein
MGKEDGLNRLASDQITGPNLEGKNKKWNTYAAPALTSSINAVTLRI